MTLAPYSSSREHWKDELRKLDAIIMFQLQCRIELDHVNPTDPMRGLIVTEDEVYRLLAERQGAEAEAVALPPELAVMQDELRLLDQEIQTKLSLSRELALDEQPRLLQLASRFGLGELEQRVVMLALAPELHRKYDKLFGFLQDDVTCKLPTMDLALKLLCSSEKERYEARSAFQGESGLRRWLLAADEDTAATLLARPLKLDPRIVSFLLEAEPFDGRLDGWVERWSQSEEAGQLQPLLVGSSIQAEMRRTAELHEDEEKPVVLHVWGQSGTGKRLQAQHLAASLGRPLLLLDASRLDGERGAFYELLNQLFREAKLTHAIPAIAGGDHFMGQEGKLSGCRTALAQWVARTGGLLLWLSQERAHYSELPLPKQALIVQVKLEPPAIEEQRMLWRTWSEGDQASAAAAEAMADKFRFAPGQISRALSHANRLAAHDGSDAVTEAHLEQGAAAQLNHELEKKARRLNPRYTWDDLILPHEPMELLQQASNMMKFRRQVYGSWGFDSKLSYGKGLSMLFAGPPGTGKTMAAEVVAKELRLEAFKIDLSQVISKYIGETEKNLHEIFKEAQRTNAILFFDESDALFGKRSEVKDAHDKYANVETAYLLQKMEEYEGISILATNFQQNIDDAFMRRINIVVKFPFPDAEHREKLWRSMFPAATPLSADVDFTALASRIEVAGGNIKNIVLTAAFMAASEGRQVGMRELVASARQELKKTGKILVNSEWDSFF
ncbi:AAA family ATPase [Paenibacillus sp. R14(2021)]|uniref:AAA family ATPase n=1 Tax=Paenibacillus sp. R14(2021) TaxID=2859228 RepID=UPI001C612077|nr:AAA family ATPase [Paenibacillus sp. R14(2021)]